MNMDTCKKNVFSIFHGFLMMFLSLQLLEVSSNRISTNQSLSGYQTIFSSGDVYELGLFTPEPAMGDELTSTSTKLWQSFDVPQCLISWNSTKDPSPGHYSLKLLCGCCLSFIYPEPETIFAICENQWILKCKIGRVNFTYPFKSFRMLLLQNNIPLIHLQIEISGY
ncbi:Uncharacterized protein Rs2_27665 [Raphanus sativus]|nr:Uncharacterized protein Rs2_27665 [Raphanus sativus]